MIERRVYHRRARFSFRFPQSSVLFLSLIRASFSSRDFTLNLVFGNHRSRRTVESYLLYLPSGGLSIIAITHDILSHGFWRTDSCRMMRNSERHFRHTISRRHSFCRQMPQLCNEQASAALRFIIFRRASMSRGARKSRRMCLLRTEFNAKRK